MYIERLTEKQVKNFFDYLNFWINSKCCEDKKRVKLELISYEIEREGLITFETKIETENGNYINGKFSAEDKYLFGRNPGDVFWHEIDARINPETNLNNLRWTNELENVWKKFMYYNFGMEYIYKFFFKEDFKENEFIVMKELKI